jgi:hypothetical protein
MQVKFRFFRSQKSSGSFVGNIYFTPDHHPQLILCDVRGSVMTSKSEGYFTSWNDQVFTKDADGKSVPKIENGKPVYGPSKITGVMQQIANAVVNTYWDTKTQAVTVSATIEGDQVTEIVEVEIQSKQLLLVKTATRLLPSEDYKVVKSQVPTSEFEADQRFINE